MTEYLFLVGMSGAGRSTAAATFEDRGWFVIDNLPPALLGKVAELANQPGAEYERLCLVSGRGGYEGVAELRPAIESLRASGARVRMLFLDASDEVLVRRYEGSRRRHPIESVGGILEAIREERELLRELRDDADHGSTPVTSMFMSCATVCWTSSSEAALGGWRRRSSPSASSTASRWMLTSCSTADFSRIPTGCRSYAR